MPALLIGPLGKILGVLAIVLALIWFGEWHGRRAVQDRWDAAIAQQAMRSADTVIHEAENTAKVEVKYIKIKGATQIITQTVEKEVLKYVDSPNQKCSLSPDFVRTFDIASSVLDAGADGLPTAARAPGIATPPADPSLTDAEVLLAHEDAVTQLRELWLAYAALVEWIRTSYAIASEGAGR